MSFKDTKAPLPSNKECYRDNASQLIEGDVTGKESKEAMLIQLNQSRELAEGVTVILV